MNSRSFDYGILVQNALVKELRQKLQNQRTVLVGTILKIEGVLGNKTFAVRFLKEDNETWETHTFCCEQGIIISVNENFWPFLATVSSPLERVKLAKNPPLCEQLMQISLESVVGFIEFGQVVLGTVKYIGNIKGIGKGFGIRLHERKINNRCNGTCTGIRYFECPPGFGVFTTVERIVPRNINTNTETTPSRAKPAPTLLEELAEKNIARISITSNSCEKHKNGVNDNLMYKNEVRIQTNAEESPPNVKILSKQSNNVKTSVSLQNISDPIANSSVNTNNDFDQNTIIQPEDTFLIREMSKNKLLNDNSKHKYEIDLIEAIGGTWAATSDAKDLVNYTDLKKSSPSERLHKKENNLHLGDKTAQSNLNNIILKSPRNKSMNPVSHLVNGSKTLPRKSKLLQENTPNLDLDNGLPNSDIKINRSNCEPKTTVSLVHYDSPTPGTTNDLTVGTLVEISNDVSEDPLYGVIRWMGIEPSTKQVIVGIELEEEQAHLPLTLTDGTHNGQRFFECAENRGIFVPLSHCHKDARFLDGTPSTSHHVSDKMFGKEMDCPIIKGAVAPLCMPTEEDVEAVCGKFRGIQGHHNSCYLDATLFAMFTFTAVFDSLLFRPKGPDDIPYYEEVQLVLREEIVNPLRTNLFVRADRVMNLRKLLDQLSSVSGLTSEEKDPEEFLNSLLTQILKARPFLKLNSGQDAYHYQLFVEKDDELTLPTVQQLFEQSFLTSDIKLKEVPSCLIIQMPRFGKNYKMYPRILPSQLLDVTDIIENSPRQCTVCGKLAKWECKQCFGECGVGLESTAFCSHCIEKAHTHSRRSSHNPTRLSVPHDFSIMAEHCHPPRLFMELFAVICIETSHYVAFVKCGVGHEAPWCFFDSMADRKGEQNGYNIPEMVACPDVSKWLSDEQSCRSLHENAPLDRYLPEHARRLLCDAYICMYQSPDVMMYR